MTFATELPDMLPKSALETTAALAGPPVYLPVMARAMSMKVFPPPVADSREPKMMNMEMNVADMPVTLPNIPRGE